MTAACLEYALLSADVYNNPSNSTRTLVDLLFTRCAPPISDHNKQGFSAGLYRLKRLPEFYILAYRGTVLTDWSNDLSDFKFWSDHILNTGPLAIQCYQSVLQNLKKTKGFSPNNLAVTGHSLGGMLAKYTALYCGCTAVAFNAPGLGDLTHTHYNKSNIHRLHTINSKGGVINSIGTDLGEVIYVDLQLSLVDTIADGILENASTALSEAAIIYQHHEISDLIRAINAQPKLALRQF